MRTSTFSGLPEDIQIITSRVVPDGVSILVDPKRLGQLLIKESVNEVSQISEIALDEKEKLLKELKDFPPEKFDESIRLLIYETIKVKILNPDAATIITTKPEKTPFLFVK